MRVVVMSDTHLGPRRRGPLPAPLRSACEGADLILHAGDLAVASLIPVLEGHAPLAAVAGNVDDCEVARLLPTQRVVEAGPLRIGMRHVPEPPERLAERFPGCRVIVVGHTHQPVCRRIGDLLLLNPGSPTERRRAPQRTYAELEIAPDGAVSARIVPLA